MAEALVKTKSSRAHLQKTCQSRLLETNW